MSGFTFSPRFIRTLLGGTLLAIGGCDGDTELQPKQSEQTELDTATSRATPAKGAVSGDGVALPPAQPRLNVDGEGLRWFLQPNGSARPIPFGRTQGEVLASLETARGPAVEGTNEDCGAGQVQFASWPDGLSLVFQKGRFVGWGLDSRANRSIATAAGIGPGATRAELEDAYRVTVSQTTLGTEFSTGDLHGVLGGRADNAIITDMWAGINCVAR